MAIQRRWKVLTCAMMLAGLVLVSVFVYGQLAKQRPGGNPMNASRFTVDHVHVATNKPFEEVIEENAQSGRHELPRGILDGQQAFGVVKQDRAALVDEPEFPVLRVVRRGGPPRVLKDLSPRLKLHRRLPFRSCARHRPRAAHAETASASENSSFAWPVCCRTMYVASAAARQLNMDCCLLAPLDFLKARPASSP
jgi:hypothetical protein